MSAADLSRPILGCGDGPAAFNAEATRRGFRVVSRDPIYRLDAVAIRIRIDETFHRILEQTRRNADGFVREVIPSVDELGRLRMSAMQEFLAIATHLVTDGYYVLIQWVVFVSISEQSDQAVDELNGPHGDGL